VLVNGLCKWYSRVCVLNGGGDRTLCVGSSLGRSARDVSQEGSVEHSRCVDHVFQLRIVRRVVRQSGGGGEDGKRKGRGRKPAHIWPAIFLPRP